MYIKMVFPAPATEAASESCRLGLGCWVVQQVECVCEVGLRGWACREMKGPKCGYLGWRV